MNQSVTFSPQDLLTCDQFQQEGCSGGRINYAWDFVSSNGLVTEACLPYASFNGSKLPFSDTCESKKCSSNATAGASWNPVKCVGKPTYLFNPPMIKAGVMAHGAATVGFSVYADFMAYKVHLLYLLGADI